MIAAYKRKANIAALVFVAAIAASLWWSSGANIWESGPLGVALGVTWLCAFFYAFYAYIMAKGRNPAWVLMLFLNVIGLIVILLLKDHAKDGQPPPAG